MPDTTLMKHFVLEALSRGRPAREPEPGLIMDDPEQVAAYVRAGREDGIMAPTYLLHTLQLCELVRPGDKVVDLACGPATQLCQVARLNREAEFLGVDLSAGMLDDARAHATEQRLDNVRFQRGDITDLHDIPSASADLVMSTLSLHHLPDPQALRRCFAEVARIVKPGGAVYLADFGRLKRDTTIHYLAHQHADQQPRLFTVDYFNSLRAAFPIQEFRDAVAALQSVVEFRLYSTLIVPFMLVIKSPARHVPSAGVAQETQALWRALKPPQKQDFEDLRMFFRMGGLVCPHPGK